MSQVGIVERVLQRREVLRQLLMEAMLQEFPELEQLDPEGQELNLQWCLARLDMEPWIRRVVRQVPLPHR